MSAKDVSKVQLGEGESRLLADLRTRRRRARGAAVATGTADAAAQDAGPTLGQTIADGVAATMGSWRFIIIQTALLTVWIVLNVTAFVQKWDPYPFILLNLALSFQAAYAAPFIMMAQNRQQDIDRKHAEGDYQINIKAELEIELLHRKIDELREKEVVELTHAINNLSSLLVKQSPPAEPAAQ